MSKATLSLSPLKAGQNSPISASETSPEHLRNISASLLACSLFSLGCAFGFTPPPHQSTLTALRALKVAQRRLRPEVRAKLLNVSSARTDKTLVPEAWRFSFMDPATSGNSRVVIVAAKTSSEHPDVVEAFGSFKSENVSSSFVISQNKLLVDSGKALEKARELVKAKGILSAEYRLIQSASGQEPTWTIRFFAEGEQPVAQVQIGTKTGDTQALNPK